MSIEISSALALGVMAVVTYLTRAGGLVIMSRMSITKRVERSLEALAGSVLVAIVVPATVEGDLAAKAAVVAAIVIMLLTRNAVAAMGTGLVAAVVIRFAG